MHNIVGTLLAALLLVGIILGPAAFVGAITRVTVRAVATHRGLPSAEVARKARSGFWIGGVIGLAVTIVLIGYCFATVELG